MTVYIYVCVCIFMYVCIRMCIKGNFISFWSDTVSWLFSSLCLRCSQSFCLSLVCVGLRSGLSESPAYCLLNDEVFYAGRQARSQASGSIGLCSYLWSCEDCVWGDPFLVSGSFLMCLACRSLAGPSGRGSALSLSSCPDSHYHLFNSGCLQGSTASFFLQEDGHQM